MSAREKLLQQCQQNSFVSRNFMGVDILVRQLSVAQIKQLDLKGGEEAVLEEMAKQFADPETKQTLFTRHDLENNFRRSDLEKLFVMFWEVNGLGEKAQEVFEKN